MLPYYSHGTCGGKAILRLVDSARQIQGTVAQQIAILEVEHVTVAFVSNIEAHFLRRICSTVLS